MNLKKKVIEFESKFINGRESFFFETLEKTASRPAAAQLSLKIKTGESNGFTRQQKQKNLV